MFQNKRIAVIIAAAGSGSRMGSGISKQYMKIGEEMVVEKSIRVFCEHPFIDDIYVVVKEKDIDFCYNEFLEKRGFNKIRKIIPGGKERQDSVYNALKNISGFQKPDYILVHDGARPFVSSDTVSRLIRETISHEAAVLGVPVKDTIKCAESFWLIETLDRNTLFSIQTPQGFHFDLLFEAHKKAQNEGYYGTDDAVLVERMGKKVYLVIGEYDNIKITTKEDIPMPREWRCGMGLDVHAFAPDRDLILGGVQIPHDLGLIGHSDADVLVHVVMDALLGACGLGDIGLHFPDTDARFKDICSLKLLSIVKERIKEASYSIGNIDVTVIAEKPKIAPYIKEMKFNLAEVLEIDETQINIKGTTTEELGFCGRKEGIAATATATVYRI